ncbi:gastrula zinc finger protein XlCGF57.1-like [Anopheles bellator]|uniref:gastrula zinc finger protein XlCGF57.1-like n=1 Tax=Anopheles bellator TaxID=139047 RepID=UPI002647FC7D|nr:gastrula zinc finger protein XlCGF57.1-like [Anopheles bellator]
MSGPFAATERFPVCRLCLGQEQELVSIFNAQTNSNPLPVRIYDMLQLNILENDSLPQSICRVCLDKIDDFIRFRELCKANERILRGAEADSQKGPDREAHSAHFGEDMSDTSDDEEPEMVVIDPMRDYESSNQSLPNGLFDGDPFLSAAAADFGHDEENAVDGVEEEADGSAEEDDGDDEDDEDTQLKGGMNVTNPPTNGLPRTEHAAHNSAQNSTVFTCKYCDVAFAVSSACQLHEMQDHDLLAPYACSFCSYKTSIRLSLISHIREMHSITRPYICIQCSKGFVRRSDLKKHTFVHTGVRPYGCPDCGKTFSRNTNLTKHMRIHSGLKQHSCTVCPRSFANKGDLVRHQKTHLEQNPQFTCGRCGNVYTRKDKLQNHELFCFRRTLGVAPLTDGVLPPVKPSDHHRFAYDVTQQLPPDAADVMACAPEMLLPSSGPPVIGLDVKPTLASFANIIPMPMMDQPSMVSSSKVYDCPSCPKRFLSKATLRKHLLTHPERSKAADRAYECPQCNKHVMGKRELERHLMSHANMKSFVCRSCGKQFTRKDKLQRHERTHQRDRRFACPNCNARFARGEALESHMRIHCTTDAAHGYETMDSGHEPMLVLPSHSMLP